MATQSSSSNPFISVEQPKPDLRKKEAPLVDIKITNPIVYIKSWWKKILGNEGMELRFKVKPLTAIAISVIVVTVSMGVGRFVFPFNIPFFEYIPIATNSPMQTPAMSRETGFTGDVRYNKETNKYFLIISSSEAISLSVPPSVDISLLVGRRIFATGKYFPDTRYLIIEGIEDLELLPKKSEPIPTTSPSPTATPHVTPLPSPTPTEAPEVTDVT